MHNINGLLYNSVVKKILSKGHLGYQESVNSQLAGSETFIVDDTFLQSGRRSWQKFILSACQHFIFLYNYFHISLKQDRERLGQLTHHKACALWSLWLLFTSVLHCILSIKRRGLTERTSWTLLGWWNSPPYYRIASTICDRKKPCVENKARVCQSQERHRWKTIYTISGCYTSV